MQSYEGQWKTWKRSGKSTLHIWLLLLIKIQPGQNHPKSKVSKVRWPSSWEEGGSSCFVSRLAPVDAGLRATFGWSSLWDLLLWPLIWSRQIKRGFSTYNTREPVKCCRNTCRVAVLARRFVRLGLYYCFVLLCRHQNSVHVIWCLMTDFDFSLEWLPLFQAGQGAVGSTSCRLLLYVDSSLCFGQIRKGTMSVSGQ